ncbi:hypothetical protein [Thermocaproicibacter melissae]|uniref:glycosyl-4,4'-diaponeurosporenoate acyltransferase CrtO family protein n=2 Tax=Thermocaproicibacter melissae TaxID=2966552 RepID=UPI0024B0428A|nr:hypothetical protein [Thermocaproicibacter melissae]WBY63727.1 hypothetical protein NOG13_07085 [Thermocaproicibacter melissae]
MLPKNSSFLDMLLWNLVIVAVWHILFFILCIKLPTATFDASKGRYVARPWEQGGRWYRENLKIQLWKDRLPQHIGKTGLSKKHFSDASIEYIDEFIMETCRGEWVHLNDCLCAVVLLLINPLLVGLVLSFFVLLGNLPCAIVQRYNRFRLQALRKKMLRDLSSAKIGQKTVTA